MGVTQDELGSITIPSLVIPGNDNTHNSVSGITAYEMLGNSELFQLPIDDVDVDLIPWSDWAEYEDQIAETMSEFIQRCYGYSIIQSFLSCFVSNSYPLFLTIIVCSICVPPTPNIWHMGFQYTKQYFRVMVCQYLEKI